MTGVLRQDDRLLLVIGAVTGACVAFTRLATSPDPDGATWLMVVVRVVVAAQGGVAVFWLLRALLRRLVTRAASSHTVRDAYACHDTPTYAVFLLSLATALGVQLIAPVIWLVVALFALAQWRLVRHAWRRERPVPSAEGAVRRGDGHAVALLAFATGGSAMLAAMTAARLLEPDLGTTTVRWAIIGPSLLGGLAMGVAIGPRRTPAGAPRALRASAAVLGVVAAWWMAAPVLLPHLAAATLGGSALAMALIGLALALPMGGVGVAINGLSVSRSSATRRTNDAAEAIMSAAVFGAGVAAFFAVDVLFAFAGVRAAMWTASGLSAVAALGAVWHSWSVPSVVEERA